MTNWNRLLRLTPALALLGLPVLGSPPSASGAPPRLVRDILTEQGPNLSVYPLPGIEIVRLDDFVLFRAWDGIHGWELWRSDGTPEGTALVADLCPGDCSSVPFELRALLGYVYFVARDSDRGEAVWRTDGTAAGTQLVADVSTRVYPSTDLSFLTAFEDELYFVEQDEAHGAELWRSDGEPDGVVELVADIQPGSADSYPASLVVVGDTLFFTADDGITGRELWKSDGTPGGTELAVDFCPGPEDCFFHESVAPPAGSQIFAAVDERLLLLASIGYETAQLWATDGTPVGSELLAEFDYPLQKFPFRSPDGAVLLAASEGPAFEPRLWRSDGTLQGTQAVGDIGARFAVAATAEAVYFAGDASDGSGQGLWRTDGTEGGSFLVADPGTGTDAGVAVAPFPLVPSVMEGSVVYFGAQDEVTGIELWRSDGTAEGTFLLADVHPGPGNGLEPLFLPNFAAELDGRVFFTPRAADFRYELWTTDGSPQGTSRLSELDLQASALERSFSPLGSDLAALDEAVLFVADDGLHGRELWRSDGSAQGTELVFDTCPDCVYRGPRSLTTVGDRVFFLRQDDAGDHSLWVSDGTAGGTQLVLATGGDFYTWGLTAWHRPRVPPRALFVHWTPHVSDGTPEGTYSLGSDYGYQPTPVGPKVFFAGSYPDTELWVSHGEPGDAVRVADIAPGDEPSNPQRITALRSRVVFSADDGLAGREPWVSNGTEQGTALLLDIRPGPEGSIPEETRLEGALRLGRRVYFPADDGVAGLELWRTNGTSAGTLPVADVNAGPGGSAPRPWVSWLGHLYFSAWDPLHGRELWRTDGTAEGTELVIDLHPGPASGVSDIKNDPFFTRFRLPAIVWQGRLYFAGSDGRSGLELWSTDGTTAGTFRVRDIHPGAGASTPVDFTPLGNRLLFSANDGQRGFELWALRSMP